MSVKFEFRRHSIKDGPTSASIGPKGYKFARAVGRRQLRGKAFTHYFASTFWRTQQTLAAFAEGAGDFAMKLGPSAPPIYLNRQEIWDMWTVCAAAERRGEDLVRAALAHNAPLVERASAEIALLFKGWATEFGDGHHVLVVGHSPHMEFLVRGLNGGTIPPLKECQGFRVKVDERSSCLVECAPPDLDPSRIRTRLFPETK